jgi:hypothetical protein
MNLEYDPDRSWIETGMLLDRAEKENTWDKSAGNFTNWMQKQANQCRLQRTTLWRYMSAGRSYERMRGDMAARGIELPPLDQLSDSVSAENIELLSKIGRAMPVSEADVLAQRILNGKVPRIELRGLWITYRAAFDGRTAQGRGVEAPQIDYSQASSLRSLMQANVISAIRNGGRDWTGVPNPKVFRVFTDVELPSTGDLPDRLTIGVVVVLIVPQTRQLEFHGIEILGPKVQRSELKAASRFAPYFDKLWVATPAGMVDATNKSLPAYFGIIHAKDSQIQVVRPAVTRSVSELKSGFLAKMLLSEAISG